MVIVPESGVVTRLLAFIVGAAFVGIGVFEFARIINGYLDGSVLWGSGAVYCFIFGLTLWFGVCIMRSAVQGGRITLVSLRKESDATE